MFFNNLSKLSASFSLIPISRLISERNPVSCSIVRFSSFILSWFFLSNFCALSRALFAFFVAYSINAKYASKSLTSLKLSTSNFIAFEDCSTSKSVSPLNMMNFRISDGRSFSKPTPSTIIRSTPLPSIKENE